MDQPVELRPDPELAEHERAYEAFNQLLRWSMVALGSGILMLTMWFATTAGFLAALFTGVVVFVVGYQLLLRHEGKPPEAAEH